MMQFYVLLTIHFKATQITISGIEALFYTNISDID